MRKKPGALMKLSGLVSDGNLTEEEALEALELAADVADEELPKALALCQTDDERKKVKGDRDLVILAHLRALKKSLEKTGPLFEKMADDLKIEAENVKKKAKELKDTVAAINLFTDLVRLAGSLALAFSKFA